MAAVQIYFNPLLALCPVSDVYSRDKLANFQLDDGILKVDFQKLGFCLYIFAGLTGMWGEYSQHPHVAAHHHLI